MAELHAPEDLGVERTDTAPIAGEADVASTRPAPIHLGREPTTRTRPVRAERGEKKVELLKWAGFGLAIIVLWYFASAPRTVFEGGQVRHLPPGSKLGSLYLPFVGETLDYTRSPFTFSHDRMKNYGHVAYSNLFGQDTILLSGRALSAFYNSTLVGRRGAYPINILELLGGEVLPMLDEPAHSKRIAWLDTAFQPGYMEEYMYRVEKLVEHATDRWQDMGRFHWVDEFRSLSARIVGSLLFSDAAQGGVHMRQYQDIINAFTAVPLHLPLTKFKAGLDARDHLFSWYGDYVHHKWYHEKQGLEIGRLLQRDRMGTDIPFSGALRELNLVALSIYAVHNSLSFMAQAISQHADVWRRAKAEVASVSPKGQITLEKLRQLPYLDQIIDEVRRFYPIFPGVFGYVKRTFVLDGHCLPKNWPIFAGQYATNHDPALYHNPHIFDPSRFYEGKMPKAALHGFCPQSGLTGQRCVGEELNVNIMRIVLIHLLRGYSWTVPPQNLQPRLDLLLPVPASGLLVHSFEQSEHPINADYIRE